MHYYNLHFEKLQCYYYCYDRGHLYILSVLFHQLLLTVLGISHSR